MVDTNSCGKMHIVGPEVNHEDFGESSVCLVFSTIIERQKSTGTLSSRFTTMLLYLVVSNKFSGWWKVNHIFFFSFMPMSIELHF